MIELVIVLSLVQGLTEFLPISSSGHLAMIQVLWRAPLPGLLFDALVHLGTLLSILWVFRRRVSLLLAAFRRRDENRHLLWLIILGTIPTALLGLLLNPWIERAFSSLLVVGLGLLCSGGLLLLAARVSARAGRSHRALEGMTVRDALLIGLAQGIAILPGISRSGLTIGVGLLLGLERGLAAEFSFLLAGPAILGAVALKGWEALQQPGAHAALAGYYLLGTGLAAISGAVAIGLLLRFVQRGRLAPFAYYCWAVGLGALLLFSLNR
ncbi:MAG: undecaprenyl-diphosphate phosphatase [Candidatus Acetothermia bacterium]|nr:undecaprenyl-diphosphate phosphatase [Candidatus Acetothermia bacterium]